MANCCSLEDLEGIQCGSAPISGRYIKRLRAEYFLCAVCTQAFNIIIIEVNEMIYNLYRLACLSRSAVSSHVNAVTIISRFIADRAFGVPDVNTRTG
jgi:hypothetical protein